MTKPTPKAIHAIRRKYDLSEDQPITAAQYREALMLATSSGSSKGEQSFCFEYRLDEVGKDRVKISVWGNHLSKNRVDSLSFRGKLAYKKAFKIGADHLLVKERKRLKSLIPFDKATIFYTFYSKRSRDHDNNSENVKRVQDMMIYLGVIKDDTRECLSLGGIKEVLSKTPRIEIEIERGIKKA